MKRTPLKRKTGLSRSTKPLTRTPLRPGTTPLKRTPLKARSKKREAEYAGPNGRRAFVAAFLEANPNCMIDWQNCTGGAVDVHETIPRGIGGAIVPGDKADRQGQIFVSTCRRCHGQLDLEPKRARHEGWIRTFNGPRGRNAHVGFRD